LEEKHKKRLYEGRFMLFLSDLFFCWTTVENTLFGERSPIRKLFSESDIEALELGYNEYVGLSFEEVKTKNHKEPAWEKNWGKRGASEKIIIPFEDLIDETWLKEELEQTSIYTVI